MTASLLRVTCILVGLAALALRIWPLVVGEPRLSQYFVTEDGYLMLTVARNMAIGLGMSVSEGTIPTNGVQPMATFLFAGAYWLVGGDKLAGLFGISVIEIAWSVAGAAAVWAFARRALPPDLRDGPWPISLGVATLWFAGPLLLRHTMNALETGLYTLFVLGALIWFPRILRLAPATRDLRAAFRPAAASAGERLAFGGYCGLVFLARNDGGFLVIALFTIWAVSLLLRERRGVFGSALILVPPGIACLMVASPWMLHNQLNFGSIMPISGSAQQVGAAFGQNLPLLPVKLFEHMFPMLPIPDRIEGQPVVLLVTSAALLAAGMLYGFALRRVAIEIKLMLLAYLGFGLMLCAFYGLHFGAPHFISRYLSPLAPLLITAGVSALAQLVGYLHRGLALRITALALSAGLVLCTGLLGRQMLPGGHDQGHFQVVDWVSTNVDPGAWVGAVQTGTLGYWHDRTINLDGKVNPAALAALRSEGHVLNYIIDSDLSYVVDWVGAADWVTRSEAPFGEHFSVLVADRDRNLAALRRNPVP